MAENEQSPGPGWIADVEIPTKEKKWREVEVAARADVYLYTLVQCVRRGDDRELMLMEFVLALARARGEAVAMSIKLMENNPMPFGMTIVNDLPYGHIPGMPKCVYQRSDDPNRRKP